MSNSVDRPGGVTLVAVLTWIGGALDILGGTILLFQTSIASTVEQFGGASQLIATAIFAWIGARYARNLNHRLWPAMLLLGGMGFALFTAAYAAGW